MRREELYLTDMVEAADAIGQFLLGVEQDAFFQNDLVRSAVLQKLIIIGEGAALRADGVSLLFFVQSDRQRPNAYSVFLQNHNTALYKRLLKAIHIVE